MNKRMVIIISFFIQSFVLGASLELSFSEEYFIQDVFNEIAKNFSFKEVMILDRVNKDFHKKADYYLSLQFGQKNQKFFYGKFIKEDFKKFLSSSIDFLDKEYPHTYLSYQIYKFHSDHSLEYENLIVDYRLCSSVENRDDFYGTKIFLSTQKYFDVFKELDSIQSNKRLIFLKENLVTEENIKVLIEKKGAALQNIYYKKKYDYEPIKELFFQNGFFSDNFLKYLIIRESISPNVRNRFEELLLCYFVKNNNIEMVRFLLKNGAKIFWSNVKKCNTFDIFRASIKNNNMEIFELLFFKILESNPNFITTGLLLLDAVSFNRKRIIDFLLVKNSIITCKEKEILYAAVKNNNSKMVQLLHNKGVNINSEVKNSYGKMTPLFVAVSENNIDMSRLLINLGAKINVCSEGYYKGGIAKEIFPLCKAIMNNSAEIVELLLENGANVECPFKGSDMFFCLDIALGARNIEIIEMLLAAGAQVPFKTVLKKIFYIRWQELFLPINLFSELFIPYGNNFLVEWRSYKKELKIYHMLEEAYVKQNYTLIIACISMILFLKYSVKKIKSMNISGKGNDIYQEVAGNQNIFSGGQVIQ